MCSLNTNLEHLQKTINLENLNLDLVYEKNWIISFSAGADSVLSLYVLTEFLKKTNWTKKKLVIYFLDHGDQNENDQNDRFNVINFHLEKIKSAFPGLTITTCFPKRELKSLCNRLGLNFEYTASRLRIKHLTRLYRIHENSLVITGHNLSDWLETVLMRLNRGTTIWNLSPFSPVENFMNMIFFRPLVFSTRKKIRKTCKALDLPYWDDPGNQTGENYRSRLRTVELVSNEKGILKSAINLINTTKLSQKVKDNEIAILKNSIIEISPNREYRVKLDFFNKLGDEQKEQVIEYILKRINCWPVSGNWRKGILDHSFHYKNIHVEKENWDESIYLIFRRGRENLNFYSPKMLRDDVVILKGNQIHKKFFIKLLYGKKSILKIFSEKKLSSRQRKNTFLVADKTNNLEVYAIYINRFGLKDIVSINYDLNISLGNL
jgi:tRNA(Ile)-lysidine synthetase-like protein